MLIYLLFSFIFSAAHLKTFYCQKMSHWSIISATLWQSVTLVLFLVNITCTHGGAANIWQTLKLPEEHIPYFFNNNEDVKLLCEKDSKCPYKVGYLGIINTTFKDVIIVCCSFHLSYYNQKNIVNLTPYGNNIYVYIYIYTYICVCMCKINGSYSLQQTIQSLKVVTIYIRQTSFLM